MTGFDEVRFPTNIAFKSKGGPERQTQIVIMSSSAEARNARWKNSKRSWDIVYGNKPFAQFETIIAFFEARNARLNGFRFMDPLDNRSNSVGPDASNPPPPTFKDQPLVPVGASTTVYQMVKNYVSGAVTYQRPIYKPDLDIPPLIGINGVQVYSPGSWSYDNTTGQVTFVNPNPVNPTWGGFFDTPVRFDTDKLVIEVADYKIGYIQSLPIVEIPIE